MATLTEIRELREQLNDRLLERAAAKAHEDELIAWSQMLGIAIRLELSAVEELAAS